MSLSQKEQRVIILVIIVSIAIAGIIHCTRQPSDVRLDIQFAGYFTDGTGVRQARFDVLNTSSLAVARGQYYEIQFKSTNGWQRISTTQQPLLASGPVIYPGDNEIVAIVAPTNGVPWKLGLLYIEKKNNSFAVIRWIRFRLGLKDGNVEKTISVLSDAVKP